MVCILSWVKYLYVILFMMGLIIPEEKFGGRKKKICMAAGLIALGLLCILSLNLQSLQNYTSTAAQVVSWTDESKYTISHILSAPVHTFGVLLRTFYYNFNYYFSGAIGGHLGWLNLSIPEMLMMVFFVFFLIGMLKTEDSLHHEVKTSTKICALTCMGLVSATVFIGLLISWNTRSSVRDTGQILFADFPLIILLARNKLIVVKKNIDYEIMAGVVFVEILTIAEIFRGALMR